MLFEGIESRVVRSVLWALCFPLFMIYVIGYSYARLSLERWMAGPPPVAHAADEKTPLTQDADGHKSDGMAEHPPVEDRADGA